MGSVVSSNFLPPATGVSFIIPGVDSAGNNINMLLSIFRQSLQSESGSADTIGITLLPVYPATYFTIDTSGNFFNILGTSVSYVN